MTIIFPGSFDPVTMGHLDIARRAAKFADKFIVAVLDNPNKQPLFSVDERVSFLQSAFSEEGIQNLEIEAFSGLLADYARLKNADAILRGLRTSGDFEREYHYAACNNRLAEAETIFLPAAPQFIHVSSTTIKEVAANMGEERVGLAFLAESLPPAAYIALQKTFS